MSAVVSLRQARMGKRRARLGHELEIERTRHAAPLERDLHAEEVLTRYRKSLAAAAFDLQSRLYIILRLGFGKISDSDRAEDVLNTTLFRLARYFGWTELQRRDIQFLSLPEAEDTRRVARLRRRSPTAS